MNRSCPSASAAMGPRDWVEERFTYMPRPATEAFLVGKDYHVQQLRMTYDRIQRSCKLPRIGCCTWTRPITECPNR